jgi:soluble calcium-activated nucleotidase 1
VCVKVYVCVCVCVCVGRVICSLHIHLLFVGVSAAPLTCTHSHTLRHSAASLSLSLSLVYSFNHSRLYLRTPPTPSLAHARVYSTPYSPSFAPSLFSLFLSFNSNRYTVRWGKDVELRSGLNEAGRGMELSALAWYAGRLLTVDDRTGAVFAVEQNEVHPVAVLADGDGYTGKGFKGEWMARKDGYLYVGSVGKEWTTQKGEVLNNNPQWVKVLDPRLRVKQENWRAHYEVLRKATGTQHPGYLMHEAVGWHENERKWYFLPRRVSREPYDDVLDERRCSNLALVASEDFAEVEVREVGTLSPSRGFSAFKWIPGRPNEVLALKTDEWGGTTQTYIAVYDLTTGAVLMPETLVGDIKFEGVEFF